jgi:4-carboxymuconolactone decarboxylase
MTFKTSGFVATIVLSTLLLAIGSTSAQASEEDSRRARGEAALARITGAEGRQVVDSIRDIAPELGEWVINFAYGEVFARPGLSDCTRELATVAALTALGNAQAQLKVHINGALNVGCRPEEVVEVILQMTVYSGFPSALNGINAAKEVFATRRIEPSAHKR